MGLGPQATEREGTNMYRIEWADGSVTLDVEDKARAVELVLRQHADAVRFEWDDPVLNDGDDGKDYPGICGFWAGEGDLNCSARPLALVREEHAQDRHARRVGSPLSYFEEVFATFLAGAKVADTLPPPPIGTVSVREEG